MGKGDHIASVFTQKSLLCEGHMAMFRPFGATMKGHNHQVGLFAQLAHHPAQLAEISHIEVISAVAKLSQSDATSGALDDSTIHKGQYLQ